MLKQTFGRSGGFNRLRPNYSSMYQLYQEKATMKQAPKDAFYNRL